jgi:hypothetical protein
VHTTRFCQPLPGIIKNKRLDNQISKKTKEPKQDQIWLTSYECSEQRDFGMVLSPILGGCQLVLLLFEQFSVLFMHLLQCVFFDNSLLPSPGRQQLHNFLIKIQNHFE